MYTKIIGTGSYVPSKMMTNEDLKEFVDTNDEWIYTRTGIKERHIVTNEGTVDLAEKASIIAIEDAGIDKSEIDIVLVATVTPDNYFPGVSQLLQARLGLNEIMAFDVNAACSGFIYVLNIADKMIKSGAYKTALIIGAETLTRLTDWRDRNTCVLFGDAAGAMIVTKSDTNNIKDVICGSRGDVDDLLTCKNVGIKDPAINAVSIQDHIHMKGSEVFKFATRILPKTVNDLLKRNNMGLEDLDSMVAHQANERIIKKAAKDLKFPMEKMFQNISHYGNTSAASVPLAIDQAIKSRFLKKGDKFITVAFGGGLTWGGALIEL
ncbi:MAG: ketoacyl-ACP synthase III [Candidatus Izimaplasma sp.]|nr:ketoacyl-ACP synthase III [Candidatus Izimaplasma bacterium]